MKRYLSIVIVVVVLMAVVLAVLDSARTEPTSWDGGCGMSDDTPLIQAAIDAVVYDNGAVYDTNSFTIDAGVLAEIQAEASAATSLTDAAIRRLCRTGRVCKVMGHQWHTPEGFYPAVYPGPSDVCGLCGEEKPIAVYCERWDDTTQYLTQDEMEALIRDLRHEGQTLQPVAEALEGKQ